MKGPLHGDARQAAAGCSRNGEEAAHLATICSRHPESVLAEHLQLIEEVIAAVCRRNSCSRDDCEEFAGTVKLKLILNDYATIRKFQGRSSFRSYLAVVIQNLFRDFRNHQWGKWRSSAQAKRLGALALRLEELRHRAGYTLDEALTMLGAGTCGQPAEELKDLAARLPVRSRRGLRSEGDEALASIPAQEPDPEAELLGKERAAAAALLCSRLRVAVGGLPAEDRLLLRLRFEEGLSIAKIAHSLQLDQKSLYRRCERISRRLRATLRAAEPGSPPAGRSTAVPVSGRLNHTVSTHLATG